MMWWDPGIHRNNELPQMRLTIDRAEVVMNPHHDGDEMRGVVKFCFSLIKDSHGLIGDNFTEVFRLSMFHDREFSKRRAQSEHGAQTVIGGMHHDCSSL
jgi:hypothetical protein